MGNDLKRWRNIPDDFVLPVPEVARILDVSEEAIYAGATNGFYFLVAPCARRLDLYEVDNADTPALADLESAGFLVLPDSAIFTLSLEGILSYPKWITVYPSELVRWLEKGRSGPIKPKMIYAKKDEHHAKLYLARDNKYEEKITPSFLGVSGALLKRFLNEGFPPPADSPRVQEIEPPPREDVRETMRAIVAGLLEEAGAAFLIERPTETEASKASALLEAIERRRGKTIAPKTLSRYLRNWLRAED